MPGVYGAADAIGSKNASFNESLVSNMMNGGDNNTIVHELGHTLGLRHIDQLREGFGDLFSGNPQYYDVNKQKANSNNAMFSGGSPYMNDVKSTQINGAQIEAAKKNYKNGTINQ